MIQDHLYAARDVLRRHLGPASGGGKLVQTWNPFMDDSIPFMFYRLRALRFRTARTPAPPVRGIVNGLSGSPADRRRSAEDNGRADR